MSTTLFDNGLYCRAEPVVQLSPPLICEQAHFDEMEQIIRHALEGAWKLIQHRPRVARRQATPCTGQPVMPKNCNATAAMPADGRL